MEAYATAQRSNHSFAVLQNGTLVGPLDAKGTRNVSSVLTENAQLAAESSGLSTSTIQRILSVAELLGRNQLTTQDLATALQVTAANAN